MNTDRCTNCGALTCDYTNNECVCKKCIAYLNSVDFNGYGRPSKKLKWNKYQNFYY